MFTKQAQKNPRYLIHMVLVIHKRASTGIGTTYDDNIDRILTKSQLQNVFISLVVINQFQHFWEQIKAENFSIKTIEKSSKKIELMEF